MRRFAITTIALLGLAAPGHRSRTGDRETAGAGSHRLRPRRSRPLARAG